MVQQLKLLKDGLSKALTSTQFKRLQVLSLGNGSVGKELNTHVSRPEFRFPKATKSVDTGLGSQRFSGDTGGRNGVLQSSRAS